jgi:hypothetical protein
MHLCFAIPWRTRWKPLDMFFHMIWTHVWLFGSLFMIIRLCFFSCYNMVAKFYCQDYVSCAHVLSSLIPAPNALHSWSRLGWCMSPQKLFFCYHLPARGRAGVKLGDAWYISNVSIIFDAPCLFYTVSFIFLFTLRGIFMRFPELTYWQDATVPVPCFLLFFVSEKLHMKYSQNWTK